MRLRAERTWDIVQNGTKEAGKSFVCAFASLHPAPNALYLSIFSLLASSCIVILYLSRHPDRTGQLWTVYCVLILLVLLAWISLGRWYLHKLSRLWNRPRDDKSYPTSSPPPETSDVSNRRDWTNNLRNTMWTVTITTLVIPPLFYHFWGPALLANVMVVQKDVVVSGPGFA